MGRFVRDPQNVVPVLLRWEQPVKRRHCLWRRKYLDTYHLLLRPQLYWAAFRSIQSPPRISRLMRSSTTITAMSKSFFRAQRGGVWRRPICANRPHRSNGRFRWGRRWFEEGREKIPHKIRKTHWQINVNGVKWNSILWEYAHSAPILPSMVILPQFGSAVK